MTATSSFRTVLRGYEPAQVDERVGELVQELHASQERAAELGRQVEALQRELAERRAAGGEAPPGASAYTGLGARIGQMLSLAEEESAHLLAGAAAEADAVRRDAEEARAAAERATAEAERETAESRRRADDLLAAAEARAAELREEAGALEAEHRARADRAAAELERDLAARRERAAAEDAQRAGAADEQLAEAGARARSVLQDAQERADRLVAEAQEQADRVRAESERELTAAAQRRDSINTSLTHVRQVLATLTGSVPVVAPSIPAPSPGAAVVDLRPAREDAVRAG